MPYKDPIKRKEFNSKYGKIWFQQNKVRLRKVREEWRKKNRKKCVEYQLEYRRRNPIKYKMTLEKAKPGRKVYARNYRIRNRNIINKKKYKKLSEDHIFRLKELVRSRIQSGLRHHTKGKIKKEGKSIMYLGCSYKKYKLFLENKFKKGMSWSNMGKSGWEIDHIKPISLFDLTKKSDQKKAFN